MTTARITTLADAAISLVAELGMRGLTHRAVDARAGMPTGTTSAYLRTRKALIEAVVSRIAELDQADLVTESPEQGAGGLDALPGEVARLLDRWLTDGRERTLARYACLLEATHHPELRQILGYGVTMRVQARQMMAAAGAPDPQRRGDYLVAAIDGLLFDRLVGAGSLSAPAPGTPESVADLAAAVRMLLGAAVGP